MSKKDLFRVLGVDPGINTTGYGVIELPPAGPPRLIEAGIVRSTPRSSLAARIHEIHLGIADAIANLAPQAMALEELYSHYQRPRTAILMGHARGVICLAATHAKIPVHHYGATRIKNILTGNGRAPKSQMQEAVQRELRLQQVPEPADVADALAAALCHGYLAGRKINVSLTTET